MNYQSYDDYMRSILGYSNMNCSDMCMNMQTPAPYQTTDNLEEMYPDTYRIVYPMVVSACNMVTLPVTEETLDRMTDDIYDRAVSDSRININIEIEAREDNNDRQISSELRQRRPRRRNRFFRDLIRILLLRELLGRRQRFPIRPF